MKTVKASLDRFEENFTVVYSDDDDSINLISLGNLCLPILRKVQGSLYSWEKRIIKLLKWNWINKVQRMQEKGLQVNSKGY